MSGIIKVFLLLGAMVCLSRAQLNEPGQQCLCQRVRNKIDRSEIKDIQIYPATIFCNKVEIVVTAGRGLRYCLNPELRAVKRLLANIIKSKKVSTTVGPSSTPGRTNTAHN
ncbi:C-X-C motif chemokine 10-like [Lates japonicus]|uniref:C-X-C motif chemokine 10-like protein n=1 Tax=Lates japonicus TaxID=270547 RepID=A0AAD3NBQ7_LATJO|nr:C-X-C motif chemokine 10-like protein [Lates japonicus]GLD70040.1 C-X-C motif chemokine 10-like protein [Lates japonicus]